MVEKINGMIGAVREGAGDNIRGIYLDESLSEFISLEEEITVPSVPVSELDYKTAEEIVERLISVMPSYLYKHTLIEKRRPSSEQHSLHLIRPYAGRLIDFVHILRIDMKLTGGYGKIITMGDNRNFPSYSTDRIKFKSRIVPVIRGSRPEDMEAIRLKAKDEIASDGRRFTSAIFDEFRPVEISIDLSMKSGDDIFRIPPKIYQFITYDYFTACLNIPDPAEERIMSAIGLFEPLFLYLFFKYRGSGHEIDSGKISMFEDYLSVKGEDVEQGDALIEEMKKYFSRYTIFRDDEMLLSGLRKIETDN